jgi:tetratricopeptide (TPR) repeat protein
MKLKQIALCASLVLIAACAGIGIPDSPDPNKKIQNAYGAIQEGRYVPANRLITEAIEIFKERNDKAGLAEAYVAYGNYHKYPFNTRPPMKKPDPQESVKYFEEAMKLYAELGDKNGVAKCHMGIGDALNGVDKKASCQHYDLAIQSYDENGKKFYINPQFKNFPEMVQAFKAQFCNGAD